MQTEQIHFKTLIKASPEKVYKTMIDDKQYRAWTSVFNATSHYKGSWNKGEKILFVGTDQDGKTGGMVARIAENIPNKFISIEHYGILKGDQEIVSGPEVEPWAGSHENYTFAEVNGRTELTVDLDTNEEYKSYFEEMWPKALEVLKSLCES